MIPAQQIEYLFIKKSKYMRIKEQEPIKIYFCLNYATSWRASE